MILRILGFFSSWLQIAPPISQGPSKGACGFLAFRKRMIFEARNFDHPLGFLRVPGCSRGGVTGSHPKDSVWEDWGTLGKIMEPPPLGPPLNNPINPCLNKVTRVDPTGVTLITWRHKALGKKIYTSFHKVADFNGCFWFP